MKKRRLFLILLSMALMLNLLPVSVFGAQQTRQEMQADMLKNLGLFAGSESGYRLHQKPTRMEAITMIVHLTGKDSAAAQESKEHPFTDVPEWADRYAAYAYRHGLSSGVSAAHFGSGNECSQAEYLTFVLRALGYRDSEGEFSWDSPYALAKKVGLTDSDQPLRRFSRGDMAEISFRALSAKMAVHPGSGLVDSRESGQPTLLGRLIENGVFSDVQYVSAAEVYAQGPKNVKAVYLTFDDGPSTKVTPRILNTLNQYGVPATFFVLGSMADKNPRLVKREFEEGHKIATHGYSHDYKAIYASPQSLLGDIQKGNAAIDRALGFSYGNKVFRFPGGSFGKNKSLMTAVTNAGYSYYDWNASGQDATKKKGSTAKEITVSAMETAKGKKGDIIVLFHDAAAKSTTADALPEIIKYYKSQGYVFRTL